MHQNRTGLYTTNSLSSHALLLLSSQTPTIISSTLQNNSTNNPQNPNAPSTLPLARKQPSTPLLATSNLDNDTRSNIDSSASINPQEGYINFKKPQNEMFKKLDGTIQKIVAAHSNLNKLYALNDFPSVGVGPKRPFELPAQLPPPPPWVPKRPFDVPPQLPPPPPWVPKRPCESPAQVSPTQTPQVPKVSPPRFKDQKGNLTPDDRKKFQDDLISMLKREISAVTKSANLKFSPPLESRSRQLERKSLLLKKSPQTLFNTIRKETSILLSKQQSNSEARSSLSLLNDQQTFNRQNVKVSPQFFNRIRPQTIRVIVPPSQHHNGLKFDNYLEKERPQPSTDMITVEQFAKCLDLVRSNDASIQRHQEQLLQAETKWRMHLSNRPLRLRRLRGEKIRMPASASYKATRKVGLQ